MTQWATSLYGALKGRLLEVIRVEHRPENAQGDLVLVETALGQRYWLRRMNVRIESDAGGTDQG